MTSVAQTFWFATGLLTGTATAFLAIPLWRAFRSAPAIGVRRYAVPVVAVLGVGIAALLIYRVTGQPDALEAAPLQDALPHAGARMPAAGEQANSVEEAAAKLGERLTRDGGEASEWLLLAQSYDFLGRAEDAASARARADGAAPGPAAATMAMPATAAATDPAALERRVRDDPSDDNAWLALANTYRKQREFEKARAAFKKVIEHKRMTADAWADYADVLGSLAGGLAGGDAAKAIDNALALDARHTKALWLKASRAHEQRRYADALSLWQALLAVLPANSPDARVIEANIAEAAELAGTPQPQTVSEPRPAATIQVAGTVGIDPDLRKRVAPGDTLFVYAKAADSPGPPLAVMRVPVGTWPVQFRLDDSMAMLPARKLSAFERVIVEARVSRSGQAVPTAGDLFVVSPVLRPADGKPVQLVISDEVG